MLPLAVTGEVCCVVSVLAQPPSWPGAKSNSVAVSDGDERVSARNVLKHDGTSPMPSNAW